MAVTADDVYARAVAEHGSRGVGVYELAFTYEAMQSVDARKRTGVWYTPDVVAEAMARMALGSALDQCGPEPEHVLQVLALDPACGCGQYLVEAARYLASEYARRLVDGEPSGALVLAVMPLVILECVFGMDIDPVSVELAKRALCLETAGALTPAMLERHFSVGNTLAGPDGPPAFEDRRRLAQPTETR